MNKLLEYLQSIPPDELPEINTQRLPRKIAASIRKAACDTSEEKKIRVVFPVFRKRAFTLALIIILTCAASVFVYAGSEPVRDFVSDAAQVVKKLFTREEELIDQNAVLIGDSTVSGDITLTVDKAVRDGETVYLYYTLSSGSGFSGDALMYDDLSLYNISDSAAQAPVLYKHMGEKGIWAGDILYDLNNKTIKKLNLILKVDNMQTGEYRLDINRLFSAKSSNDSDTEMHYTEYLNKLSAKFSLDDIMNELPEVEYEPETPINIDKYTLTFEKIRITPISVELIISDRLGQRFESYGYNFTAMDYLKQFVSPLNVINKKGAEFEQFFEETGEMRRSSYNLYIKFKDDITSVDPSQGGRRWNYIPYKAETYDDFESRDIFLKQGDCMNYTIYFTSPIYPTDIEYIYLESDNSHYFGGESDIIIIWDRNKDE